MLKLTLAIFSLIIGTSFLFTKSAGAWGYFLQAPPYVNWSDPVECSGTCNFADTDVCCDGDDYALGGGISLDLGDPPDNTDAGDNVAAQNSHPEDPNCWYVSARELQNNPGAGGASWDSPGSSTSEPSSFAGSVQDCSDHAIGQRPTYCYFNWNSSTGTDPKATTSSTGSTWYLRAYVICSSSKSKSIP